ncbi:alpha/beta fold hydrolase [Larsenimonas rhizosphaerae]|uniref:Alpha/beta hydrolase n=1 Tax=Larsenimonas rhizosphaerae TaxID=2944682 RepID=A0AA41ZES4_9GAMM|nr:alpha/beta hydrolase [Larsenimonas rhizosphaerae]MCX2523276.1 alpha/beta hydrolase [Larsenimonas rhizosphaerae]
MTTSFNRSLPDDVAPHPVSLADGRLAGLAWGRAGAPLVIALHGWLDNSMSYSRLAPALVCQHDIYLVALDLSGHGHSDWLPGRLDYALWDYVQDVLDTLDHYTQDEVTVIGHSMGASVALLASLADTRIRQLWLIDGLGMLTTPATEAAEQLKRGIRGLRRSTPRRPTYPDAQAAVRARVKGGVTAVDDDVAWQLVPRNLEAIDGAVRLRTDPRLMRPSLVRFTPAQRDAILQSVTVPVALIEADQGILGEAPHAVRSRACLPTLTRHCLPGGHHLHLELDRIDEVASLFHFRTGSVDSM